jgi:hypothetical protein
MSLCWQVLVARLVSAVSVSTMHPIMGVFISETSEPALRGPLAAFPSIFLALGILLVTTLQRHNTENSKQIFPEKELHGLSPNLYIHVSVSDFYILMIGLPILPQENRWTNPGNV